MKEKEELSDFIKMAYERGGIKNVEEAFKEYPVEEEWHKGQIDYFLKEDSEEYTFYNIGDIVFVANYMYSDGKIGKNHLFVIIDKEHLAIPVEYMGMLISSQLDKLKFESNKLLKKDKDNKLDRDSIVKTDWVYKISNRQIMFKIGSVDMEIIEEYKESYFFYNE